MGASSSTGVVRGAVPSGFAVQTVLYCAAELWSVAIVWREEEGRPSFETSRRLTRLDWLRLAVSVSPHPHPLPSLTSAR